jgi:hypothetical protein
MIESGVHEIRAVKAGCCPAAAVPAEMMSFALGMHSLCILRIFTFVYVKLIPSNILGHDIWAGS